MGGNIFQFTLVTSNKPLRPFGKFSKFKIPKISTLHLNVFTFILLFGGLFQISTNKIFTAMHQP